MCICMYITVHHMPKCMSCHKTTVAKQRGGHTVFMILYPSYFCESCVADNSSNYPKEISPW